ncbi:MAG: Fis family transcriptional regulator [Acidobacteria bacterium]|nr:MAG: Fis family transcriptional regulator [Acidobacteria bacterium 13_1_40CM_2_68_10]PYT36815.1 MAG: Fis family transcriptional regulator [Acidobacteriota bacterium]
MSKERILVVDDEEGVRNSLRNILKDEGYSVEVAESGERCLEMVRSAPFHAILLDVWLKGRDGLSVLEEVIAQPRPPRVIMISGHADVPLAHKAGRLGAFDFIEKPLSLEKVALTLRNAVADKKKDERIRQLREQLDEGTTLIGDSRPIRELRQQIEVTAPTNGRVLIFGENGTGKELVARAIHALSARRDEPFVEMNCAAIPEELIESELFGHVKGSFTGAGESKPGRFALADGGTLFLDEIADMSLRTQAKVLRVLQEQAFEPVGGSTLRVDVRVIAATNKDLKSEIASGRFREDLYFRLNVVPLRVPPLRERPEDVPPLALHFVEQFSRAYGRVKTLAPEAVPALQACRWTGNVRELKNVIERLVILTPGSVIGLSEVRRTIGSEPEASPDLFRGFASLREGRENFERQFIQKKLEEAGGNVVRAAELLGLERSNLYRKMRAYGIRGGDGS